MKLMVLMIKNGKVEKLISKPAFLKANMMILTVLSIKLTWNNNQRDREC